jgi:DNA-binding MarR family transcriptional regulator
VALRSALTARGGAGHPVAPDLAGLFHDLVRFETRLWQSLEFRLQVEHDLTMGRFEVMRHIEAHPRCRVQDIAAELAITVGGTSKLVDRIETSGYCRRLANPVDGRSSLIELTGAGQRLCRRAGVAFVDELGLRVGSTVPAADLDHLGRTLTALRAAQESRPAPSPQPSH